MEKNGLSQEGLKLIACVTMLIDHIGASLVPTLWMRVVGRIAFPIFCFLLAEGIHYTCNPRRYGLRLLTGAVLSEAPFELLFFDSLTLRHTSVMVTLLLGFLYGISQKKASGTWLKILLLLPFMLAASLLSTDYGGVGVALIGVFVLTREMKHSLVIQTVCSAILFGLMNSFPIFVGPFPIPIEMFALLSMVPIALYSGRKVTAGKAAQWGFYLFYPVHLAVLCVIHFWG